MKTTRHVNQFILIVIDLALLILALLVSLAIRTGSWPSASYWSMHIVSFRFIFAAWILVLYTAGLYNPDMAFFLAIAPWPYSEIYPSLKDHIEVKDYSRYNLVEPVVKPKNMTIREVQEWLGKASREFFTHKMHTLDAMSPKKREFMVKVIHIIATSSYLAKTMKGTMPEDVKKMLEKLHLPA